MFHFLCGVNENIDPKPCVVLASAGLFAFLRGEFAQGWLGFLEIVSRRVDTLEKTSKRRATCRTNDACVCTHGNTIASFAALLLNLRGMCPRLCFIYDIVLLLSLDTRVLRVIGIVDIH